MSDSSTNNEAKPMLCAQLRIKEFRNCLHRLRDLGVSASPLLRRCRGEIEYDCVRLDCPRANVAFHIGVAGLAPFEIGLTLLPESSAPFFHVLGVVDLVEQVLFILRVGLEGNTQAVVDGLLGQFYGQRWPFG